MPYDPEPTPTGLKPRNQEVCAHCAASIALHPHYPHDRIYVDVHTHDEQAFFFCFGGSVKHQPVRFQ